MGIGGAAIRAARDTAPAISRTLQVAEVDDCLERIAASAGAGSSAAKTALLRDVFGRATDDEQEFLARLLFGELRQGALESVLMDAVAKASGIPLARIRRAAMAAGALTPVALAALTEGAAALDAFTIQVMQPVQPMLADSADDVSAALDASGPAAVEYKLDGARIQVHKRGDDVRVFSRALNDVTQAVPEVVDAVRRLPARSIDPRWRGDRSSKQRIAGAVSGHDAPLRSPAGRRAPARRDSHRAVLLRLPAD